MHKQLMIVLVLVGIVGISGLVCYGVSTGATDLAFVPRPLTTTSTDAIAHVAVRYATSEYVVGRNPPRVLLATRVTNNDLPKWGFRMLGFAGGEPPLALVILQGNFEPKPGTMDYAHGTSRFTYLGYVFDLHAGVPTLIVTSPDRTPFQQAFTVAGIQVVDEPGPTAYPTLPAVELIRPGDPRYHKPYPAPNGIKAVPYPSP